ncbi:hypothetical protein BGW80DRAFT_1465343 [Lactifluus volemus]|nr:hypothetical protein BGW80DRAFT_1465343 [Lactifluus volemus]
MFANHPLHSSHKALLNYQLPPPPYAWTQDWEEITMPVALPLPSSTSKTDINILFSPQTLTVHVQNCASPRYTAAQLWGSIAPGSSFWTWDAHGAHAYGLLTLHLEKQHAGTRWPHVFDLTTSSSREPEVAETLDPLELYTIRESLKKYTAELREGGGAATVTVMRAVRPIPYCFPSDFRLVL